MLFLRNPDETVLVNEGGISINPGKEVFIELHRKEVHLSFLNLNFTTSKSFICEIRFTLILCLHYQSGLINY